MRPYCLLLLLTLSGICWAQTPLDRSGTAYAYWGWNRAIFSNSNIHFQGAYYNFTIYDVIANDRQTPFNGNTYLNPAHATIPQYNFRIGYFLDQHYSLSFGIDHMKYVMQNMQEVLLKGNIEAEGFSGEYEEYPIVLSPEFLQFEHTDGLNYINIEYRRTDEILKWKTFSLNITEGLGTGILMPKTKTTILGKERYDEFHLSGYGINTIIGTELQFGKYFFIQSELKGGWINMPDIRTTTNEIDRANQYFWFGQANILFGSRIYW